MTEVPAFRNKGTTADPARPLDTRLYRVAEHILHALCATAIGDEKRNLYQALEALGCAEIAALNRLTEAHALEVSAEDLARPGTDSRSQPTDKSN